MTDWVEVGWDRVMRVRTQIARRFIIWTHLADLISTQAQKNWFFQKNPEKLTKSWNLGIKTSSWIFDLNTKNGRNSTSNWYPIRSHRYLIQEKIFQNIAFSNFLVGGASQKTYESIQESLGIHHIKNHLKRTLLKFLYSPQEARARVSGRTCLKSYWKSKLPSFSNIIPDSTAIVDFLVFTSTRFTIY